MRPREVGRGVALPDRPPKGRRLPPSACRGRDAGGSSGDEYDTEQDGDLSYGEALQTAKKQKRRDAGNNFTIKNLKRGDEERKRPSPCRDKNCYESNKKWKKKMIGENSQMCHQCQRNVKGRVVWCKSCSKKRFCVSCIQRWYPDLSEDEFATKCPYCRKNCNCKACLRMLHGVEEAPKKEISVENQVCYACHVVRFLLPWLRKLQQEQMKERELEAKIKGLFVNEVKLEQAECSLDERVYW